MSITDLLNNLPPPMIGKQVKISKPEKFEIFFPPRTKVVSFLCTPPRPYSTPMHDFRTRQRHRAAVPRHTCAAACCG